MKLGTVTAEDIVYNKDKILPVDRRQVFVEGTFMKSWKIASIPGDGVGKEVVPAAERVLHAMAEVHGGFQFEFTSFPWSCEYYLEHGVMMPEDGLIRWRLLIASF